MTRNVTTLIVLVGVCIFFGACTQNNVRQSRGPFIGFVSTESTMKLSQSLVVPANREIVAVDVYLVPSMSIDFDKTEISLHLSTNGVRVVTSSRLVSRKEVPGWIVFGFTNDVLFANPEHVVISVAGSEKGLIGWGNINEDYYPAGVASIMDSLRFHEDNDFLFNLYWISSASSDPSASQKTLKAMGYKMSPNRLEDEELVDIYMKANSGGP